MSSPSLEDERQLANLKRKLDEIGSILGEIEGKYAEIASTSTKSAQG